MAISLLPRIDSSLDQLRVLKMLLIHDIVEIDAGDTFCYTVRHDKAEREQLAGERIFGLLPDDVAQEFMELWREFEAFKTKESAFANALDRLLPLIQNSNNDGQSWKEHGITYEQAYYRNQVIQRGSKELWDYAEKLLIDASARGLLPKQAEQGGAVNPHAFGTFVTHPADAGSAPKASGDT